MCGRYTLTVNPADLQAAFDLELPPPAEMAPRYNIAPTQPVAIVANRRPRQIEHGVWGLIPSWAKDPAIGSRMINARSETLAEKPSFRTALKRRRCLVLADGFYEWKAEPGGKTPVYIQLQSGQPFALAGLWEVWNAPDGGQILSCTIITTEPNELMRPIHNRMPVILPRTAYAAWLHPEELPAAESLPLLQPYPAEEMKAVTVSRLVNNPRVDNPDCVRPA